MFAEAIKTAVDALRTEDPNEAPWLHSQTLKRNSTTSPSAIT
ncbi:hypothetical protein DFJ75_1445 [Williamsia muralis]|uniref:Uncharacterized protein n=1 Tax=Williamsia marianensis TaxID=85044 RepID=A0A495K099_WILMA|nr:hypothetical protein DFJ75_1445 [Williamsia muralis]